MRFDHFANKKYPFPRYRSIWAMFPVWMTPTQPSPVMVWSHPWILVRQAVYADHNVFSTALTVPLLSTHPNANTTKHLSNPWPKRKWNGPSYWQLSPYSYSHPPVSRRYTLHGKPKWTFRKASRSWIWRFPENMWNILSDWSLRRLFVASWCTRSFSLDSEERRTVGTKKTMMLNKVDHL